MKSISINNHIRAQKLIRIFSDAMPFGDGNQASSINIINQLRGLGFQGKIEFIYSKGEAISKGQYQNKNKIIKLFGLPNNLPASYDDLEKNITFIETSVHYKRLKEGQLEPCELSFSGGQLVLCLDGAVADQLPTHDVCDRRGCYELPCSNEATTMGSKVHMNIQPYFGQTPLGGNVASISVAGINSGPTELATANNKFFNPRSESLAEAATFVENHKETLPAGVSAFISAIKQNQFNMIPIHGWAVKDPNLLQMPLDLFPETPLRFIFGARLAQLKGPENITRKPLVLAFFYDYQSELKDLEKIIVHNDWGKWHSWEKKYLASTKKSNFVESMIRNVRLPSSYPTPYGNRKDVKNIIQKTKLANHLVFADINDPNLASKFNSMSEGQLMLLSVGRLPQPVFNGIFMNSPNILMQVCEGENTRNALIANSNKPFMRSLPWALTHYGYGPQDTQLADWFDQYNSQTKPATFNEQCQWIQKFIIDANTAQSPLQEYYKWLHETATNPENDRFLYTLKTGLQALYPDAVITLTVTSEITKTLIPSNEMHAEEEISAEKMCPLTATNSSQEFATCSLQESENEALDIECPKTSNAARLKPSLFFWPATFSSTGEKISAALPGSDTSTRLNNMPQWVNHISISLPMIAIFINWLKPYLPQNRVRSLTNADHKLLTDYAAMLQKFDECFQRKMRKITFRMCYNIDNYKLCETSLNEMRNLIYTIKQSQKISDRDCTQLGSLQRRINDLLPELTSRDLERKLKKLDKKARESHHHMKLFKYQNKTFSYDSNDAKLKQCTEYSRE